MSVAIIQVHEYLIELARQRSEPITYSKLAHHFGMTIRGDGDVNFWSRLLGEISTIEHSRGQPMLSTLVINEEKNRPGDGYYNLARDLGKYNGHSENERMEFYSTELQAVYNHWAKD